MKVYVLRHKETGQYSQGGRYVESTTDLPRKLWYSYEEFLKFLKYYVDDRHVNVIDSIECYEGSPNWKDQVEEWKKWKPVDALKDFELVTFDLEEDGNKNDTLAKIIKRDIKIKVR
jgi:hypothetical protein